MNNKIRLIIMSNSAGNEEVIFTEDFDVPGTDFCNPGFSPIYDNSIYMDLPSQFPTEHNLRKEE